MEGCTTERARSLHEAVTLVVCAARRIPNHAPLAWVFESEAAALFAGAQSADQPWFVMRGAPGDPDAALNAPRTREVVLSHSARAPVPILRTGPPLRKCGVPAAIGPRSRAHRLAVG